MYPDLMGPAGFQHTAHQRAVFLFVVAKQSDAGQRGLAAAADDHAACVMPVSADGIAVFLPLRGEMPVDYRKIAAADLMRLHHLVKQWLKQRIFAEEQDAAGAHIQAMQRAYRHMGLSALDEMITERVAYRVLCIVAIAVHEQAAFFIDDRKQLIFMKDIRWMSFMKMSCLRSSS